jgi:aspartyl-tRNA(Asn)/glutamyl-tRNA(Gln) amidotransferase subunit C
MSLTAKDVTKIAHLARVEMGEQDLTAMVSSLGKILAFVNQLESAPVADLAPMAHPLAGEVQRLRDDRVTEVNVREKLQAIAPEVVAGLYCVPRVIE